MYPDPVAPKISYELLARIQDILEESCFYNARRRGKSNTSCESGTCPEYFELQNWEADWQHLYYNDFTDEELTEIEESRGVDGRNGELKRLRIGVLDKLEICATSSHIGTLWRTVTCQNTRLQLCCTLYFWTIACGALEVEVLGEAFITRGSRRDVITRLLKDSANDYSSRRKAILALPEVKNVKASLRTPFISRGASTVQTETSSSAADSNQAMLQDVAKCTINFSGESRPSHPKLNLFFKVIFPNSKVASVIFDEPYKASFLTDNLVIDIFVLDRSKLPALRKYRFSKESWLLQGSENKA